MADRNNPSEQFPFPPEQPQQPAPAPPAPAPQPVYYVYPHYTPDDYAKAFQRRKSNKDALEWLTSTYGKRKGRVIFKRIQDWLDSRKPKD